MSHCQIILDGRTVFDGPIGPNVLPTTPDLIPQALRAFNDKTAPITPAVRMMALGAILTAMRDLLSKQFGVSTEIRTYAENRHTINITPI